MTVRHRMKHCKIVWAGFSWFVAGIVADFGIGVLVLVPLIVFDIQWVTYVLAILLLLLPIAFAVWAVVREIRRQKSLGLESVPQEINDPVLGRLSRGDEPDAWEAHVSLGARQVIVRIDGEGLPDPPLLQQAKALITEGRQFLERVEQLKQAEVVSKPRLREYSAEIQQLQVATLGFYAIRGRIDVMAYFDGGRDGRSWHTVVVDGAPTTLGFDT